MQINVDVHVHEAFHVRETFHVREAFRVREIFRVRACGLRILLRAPPQALLLPLPLLLSISFPQPSWNVGAFPSSHPSLRAQHEASLRAQREDDQQAQQRALQRAFPQAWQRAFPQAQQQQQALQLAFPQAQQQALLLQQAWPELRRVQPELRLVQVCWQEQAEQQLVLVLVHLRALRCEDVQHRRTAQREDRQERKELSSINYKQDHHQLIQILFFETKKLNTQNLSKPCEEAIALMFRLSWIVFCSFQVAREE